MRPGHHRPLGTTTWMRFPEWTQTRPPELGDVAAKVGGADADDADLWRRAYRVVGVEEGRTRPVDGEPRTSYRLLMERVGWDELLASTGPGWTFYDLPR